MTTDTDIAKVESGLNGAQKDADSSDAGFCENVRTLFRKSTNAVGFLIGFLAITTASIGWTLFLIIAPLLPGAGLIIGAWYREECPVEERIPIWLIVWGGVIIIRKIIALGVKQCSEDVQNSWCMKFVHAFDIFLVIWFICGSAWVFGVYKPDYDNPDDTENYCHAVPYLFAFIYLIVHYVILLIVVIVILVACICFTVACCGAVHEISEGVRAPESEMKAADNK